MLQYRPTLISFISFDIVFPWVLYFISCLQYCFPVSQLIYYCCTVGIPGLPVFLGRVSFLCHSIEMQTLQYYIPEYYISYQYIVVKFSRNANSYGPVSQSTIFQHFDVLHVSNNSHFYDIVLFPRVLYLNIIFYCTCLIIKNFYNAVLFPTVLQHTITYCKFLATKTLTIRFP